MAEETKTIENAVEKEQDKVGGGIVTDALDGEYKFDQSSGQGLSVAEYAKPISLKKVNKPFKERTDIDFDVLYYGDQLPCGLVEVRKRSPRDMSFKKWNDRVMWYEGNIIINGEGRKIAYHVIHEPSPSELFADYFYPTTQWDISRALVSEQDNVPGWKRMVAMKTIQGLTPEPFRAMVPGRSSTTINAFHFVLINRQYRPVEQGSKKIDGLFVLSPPASGIYIKSYRDAIKIMGGSPIGLSRQRAADSTAIIG